MWGWLRIGGHTGQGRVTDRAGHAYGSEDIQFVGVEEDPGFKGRGDLAVPAEAVSADAVLDGRDTVGGPAFIRQELHGKAGRTLVVAGSFCAGGRAAWASWRRAAARRISRSAPSACPRRSAM